jgi:hypothetical protein
VTPTKIPPLWVVSANKPVLTSPSGTTFRMSYDRADAARFAGHFFDQLARRDGGAPARVAAACPVLADALDLFLGATDARNESALGPMLVLYLGAVMHGVTWADLSVEVPRG